MNKIKLTIVYYSVTGINFQLANWAKEVARLIKLGKENDVTPIH